MAPDDERENGPDVEDARAAFQRSRAATTETEVVVAESRRRVEEVRAIRRENHLADKFRLIIQGARTT